MKRKKQIRDLTSDVPEDIIVMDQNLLRHPESIEIDSGKLTKQAMLKNMSKYVERLLN